MSCRSSRKAVIVLAFCLAGCGAADSSRDGCHASPPPDDMDCDGVPASEDCDDSDPTVPATDADCDGVKWPDDCDDNDPTLPANDADCDGVPTAEDCDDTDPAVWNPTHDVVPGDLVDRFSDFCDHHCRRDLEGSLDLKRLHAEDARVLYCLSAVGADLVVQRNENLVRLSGLDALTTVG